MLRIGYYSIIIFVMNFGVVFSASTLEYEVFLEAERNGWQAQEAFQHCMNYVHGWLAHLNLPSGLIPRNLTDSPFWNAKDSAADNYPFMVLTCALLNRDLFEGTMKEMLKSETRLTSRLDNLPDDFDFASQTFRTKDPSLDDMIFGGSEYVKDGLVPLTEWLGKSPWSQRMLSIMDSIWKHAPVETRFGKIPSIVHEVNGDNLQVLARIYWMTGDERYKEWAFRLADYYFEDQLPTESDRLQLDDHGCEVVDGLAGAYYLAVKTDPQRASRYREAMHRMLDRILEVGVNEDGFVYEVVNPRTCEVLSSELSDNWGYNYNAFLNVSQLDQDDRYRAATERILQNVYKYKDYPWENGGADGYADAIEGGLNLLNRIPVESAFDWVEYSMKILLSKQRKDGIIEGWHGDGNFARTVLMYALWKTQGTQVYPWRADLALGAVKAGDDLYLNLRNDWPWKGKICLDIPRHKEWMKLPSDYPRINQFPEWFTVELDKEYEICMNGESIGLKNGRELHEGLELDLPKNKIIYIKIIHR